MSTVGVATGHPDGEDRAMPHGGTILTGAALSVNGGVDLPGFAGFFEVAGYRSLVVVVNNKGATALTVTPHWDFYEGPGSLGQTDAQTVAAGASKRMLFQNQGDIVRSIHVAGGGAGDTIDYHVVPSNLDPLAPSGTPDYIMLTGIATAIPSVVGGASGQVPWDETVVRSNDLSFWTYTLDGAGHIVQVKTTKPGRYEAFAVFHFDAPAASTDETFSLSMTGVVGGNVIDSAAITTTKIYEGTVGVFGESSGIPSVFEADYSLDTATTSNVRGQRLWIKRWAL